MDLSDKTDSQGVLLETVRITSSDGRMTSTLPRGSRLLDAQGRPVKSLTLTPWVPPQSEYGLVVGVAYRWDEAVTWGSVDPNGNVTIKYDPPPANPRIDPNSPAIGVWWDERNMWARRTRPFTVDPVAGTLSGPQPRFHGYAVIYWYTDATPIDIVPPPTPTPAINPTSPPAPTPPPAPPPAPAGGGTIAFDSNREGNFEIYVMNADGTGQKRLTANTAVDAVPAWSYNGAKIAFTSNRDGDFEIYVMNADGSVAANLTNDPSSDGAPAWSPDGTRIAFESNRLDANYEIYVMNSDGTGVTRLTEHLAGDHDPAWSPDGTRIAFTTYRDGWGILADRNYEVYAMNADGSGQTRLTDNPAYDAAPVWSPDGTRIAFESNRDGNYEIYIMNADGTGQTRLTNNSAGDWSPAWSPDGSRIAFTSNRDGNLEVYVMNADGTGQTRLTNDPALDEYPAWSR